uniref:G_PROTEIN_RECEP_F1_2 domain-containing protein n=1 Tax=Macrostomum lignano TaxID=282301 RepID=A0A1I8HR20_9PLAT
AKSLFESKSRQKYNLLFQLLLPIVVHFSKAFEYFYRLQLLSFNPRISMSYNNTTSSGTPTGVHSFGTASRAFIWAAFFAIMCISIVGNSLVIWVIVAHTKMRIITNFFLLNLSISDLMVVTLQVVPNVIYTLEQNWKFGLFYCRVSNFMTTFSISLSVFTFMAIAIERYVVIMHPLRPRPKRLAIIASIAFIWAFSMVTAAPPAIFSELQVNEKMFTNCNIAAKVFVAYNYVLMTLQYLVPVIVVGIAYIIIGIRLWTQQPIGEQTQAQEETIVLMMITVVVIFALCWLPYQISFFFSNNSAALFIALYFLAICSTWPNPFIYCKMNNK